MNESGEAADITQAEIDAIGEFDDAVAAEQPEPEADKAPEKAPEAEPEPETEAEAELDEDDILTLNELDERMKASAKEAAKEAIREIIKEQQEESDDDDLTPEALKVKRLEQEKAALEAKLKEKESTEAAATQAAEDAKIQHAIATVAGKYKLTDDELDAVAQWYEDNPDLSRTSFETATLRVLPDVKGRLNAAPGAATPPANGEAAGGFVTDGANGAGAPKPFKHDGRRGNYEDVTANTLRSGEAAKLGSYK